MTDVLTNVSYVNWADDRDVDMKEDRHIDVTGDRDVNWTGDRGVYELVHSILYRYGLPVICAFGFVGNVMNLVILTGKRIQHSLRSLERSANMGLIALAVADLSFCVSAFPSTFLPEDMIFAHRSFLAYYGCYCAAVINVFIMTSTWLTVTMSTEVSQLFIMTSSKFTVSMSTEVCKVFIMTSRRLYSNHVNA